MKKGARRFNVLVLAGCVTPRVSFGWGWGGDFRFGPGLDRAGQEAHLWLLGLLETRDSTISGLKQGKFRAPLVHLRSPCCWARRSLWLGFVALLNTSRYEWLDDVFPSVLFTLGDSRAGNIASVFFEFA